MMRSEWGEGHSIANVHVYLQRGTGNFFLKKRWFERCVDNGWVGEGGDRGDREKGL